MGILLDPQNAEVKERQKWEHNLVIVNGTPIQPISWLDGGKGGMPFHPYPKMLYRAERADGGPRISKTHLVHDKDQESIAIGQGWSLTQEAALADVGRRHTEEAKLAAERHATERWMSEGAQAEAAAVDEATMQHVPVIPETPIVRRQAKEGK